jgi:hypothetical protein
VGIDIGLHVGDIRHPTSTTLIPISEQNTSENNPLIPISEEFRYLHQLPFGYRTKSISDIRYLKLKNHSYMTRINFYYYLFYRTGLEPTIFMFTIWHFTIALQGYTNIVVGYQIWDIRYGISDKTLFRYQI